MFDLEKVDFVEASETHLERIFRHNGNTTEIVAKALAGSRLISVTRICIGYVLARNENALAILVALNDISPQSAETAFQAICEVLVAKKAFYDSFQAYQQHLNPLDFPARIIFTLEHHLYTDEENIDLFARLKAILSRFPNLPQEPVIPPRS